MTMQMGQQFTVTVSLSCASIKARIVPNNVLRFKAKPFFLRTMKCRSRWKPESRSCQRKSLVTKAIENGRETSESGVSEAASAEKSEQTEAGQVTESRVELSEVGAEIKKVLQERKEKEENGGLTLFSGVAEEIREIEWPVFGKVLGTTGVVLGVIAGSSVVLLTVNAVLAELSDKVFSGRGVHDFFS